MQAKGAIAFETSFSNKSGFPTIIIRSIYFFVVVPRLESSLGSPTLSESLSPLPQVAPPQLVLKSKKHRCRKSDLSWCGPRTCEGIHPDLSGGKRQVQSRCGNEAWPA